MLNVTILSVKYCYCSTVNHPHNCDIHDQCEVKITCELQKFKTHCNNW